ncbi:MAG TPA: DEAD/DEAH box helicase, partial [Bacteroidia bacterium]|nr:DEAD/DEAH box helicase [Bacteroidia bacterium]
MQAAIGMEGAQQALKSYFGYDEFRPQQAEIIARILEKRDAIVLMPTGGGKSLCFQIPAIVMPGVCIVVSPLIALMKDQVEGLKANGVKADFINSSRNSQENQQVESLAIRGELDL